MGLKRIRASIFYNSLRGWGIGTIGRVIALRRRWRQICILALKYSGDPEPLNPIYRATQSDLESYHVLECESIAESPDGSITIPQKNL